MNLHLTDQMLAYLELSVIQEYKIKHRACMYLLKKIDKVEWLKTGDKNTILFHQSIKSRNVQNQVYSIHDMDGVWKIIWLMFWSPFVLL